jgi:peptidoglycan glycosyltransferase
VNRPIRRVGYAVVVLMLILVGQLTYLQVVDADRLANDPRNVRPLLRAYNRARGQIITADGQIVAESVPTTGDFKYQRKYPLGPLFAQVSGYQSFVGLVGNTGVEASYDKVLTGQDLSLRLQDVGGLLDTKADTNNVVLSLKQSTQQAAADALNALGDTKGSVVALDVKTGEVLAMYSNPTYDPNFLAVHDSVVVQTAFNFINSDESGKSALQRAYREIYPPGSTFKVVTTKSALELGTATPDTQFPFSTGFDIPGTDTTLKNFRDGGCGGDTLTASLVESCNATFAQLGYEMGPAFVPQMDQCGIHSAIPIDLEPSSAVSQGPTATSEKPRFALAGIGQGDVFTSPLQMAVVAAAVANGGVIKEPHVVQEIQDSEGRTIKTNESKDWRTCMSSNTAAALREMMLAVVEGGTGTAARIAGVEVAGKTGTAQVDGALPHAWFIAFAPADNPQYAVSVVIPNGGSNQDPEVTGGRLAAPIARKVLASLLGVPG